MASTEHKDPTHRAHLWERVTPETAAPEDGFGARIVHGPDHDLRTVLSQAEYDDALASGYADAPLSIVMVKGDERWLVHSKAEKDLGLAHGWTIEEPAADGSGSDEAPSKRKRR